jgi:NAD(P)-dependent dehydrogenase (short-subunit alcohol dehydrogenase family)
MDTSRNSRPDGKGGIGHGAVSGIGFCTALELSRAGARVTVAVRDETKGKDAIRKVADRGA